MWWEVSPSVTDSLYYCACNRQLFLVFTLSLWVLILIKCKQIWMWLPSFSVRALMIEWCVSGISHEVSCWLPFTDWSKTRQPLMEILALHEWQMNLLNRYPLFQKSLHLDHPGLKIWRPLFIPAVYTALGSSVSRSGSAPVLLTPPPMQYRMILTL